MQEHSAENIRFADRRDAGARLAIALGSLGLLRPVLLGVPRGGVIVAAAAADGLGADLDFVLARKLRHPLQPELAIGAVGEGGQAVLLPEAHLEVPHEMLAAEAGRQAAQIAERASKYRAVRPLVPIEGRDAVIIDDGVATGSTVAAAAAVVRQRGPARLIIALPVGPPGALDALRVRADALVCLQTPARFFAVGAFYDDFAEVTDEQVIAALSAAGKGPPPALSSSA